jgi:hypothetical protein
LGRSFVAMLGRVALLWAAPPPGLFASVCRALSALPPQTFLLNNIRDNKGALKPVSVRRWWRAGGCRGEGWRGVEETVC